jgi:hypothetical protein
MSRDQEIQDIVNQLERLQIQQAELVRRIGRLSENNDVSNINATHTTSTIDFVIGDRVRIRNPGRLQPVRGTIIKIGRSRITVEAREGTKIVRAPRNLIAED